MKKVLLTLAAAAMTAGAWAQTDANGLIDVTPNYYKFYQDTEANLTSILRSDLRQPVAFNLGSDNWITSNTNGGENYFTTEQIANGNILFGSFVFNQTKEKEFAEAYSIYDFGGAIGKVMVLNGQKSELGDAIKTVCNLDVAPEIPAYQGAIGANFQMNHLMDWISMQPYVLEANPGLTPEDLLEASKKGSDIEVTPIRIRVRLEINGYNNDMSAELNTLNQTFVQNEAGNIIGGVDNTADSYIDNMQFADENGNWSPNLWVVREWDMDYAGVASYIKFTGTNTESDLDNGAILVRSLEVYILGEGAETYANIEGKTYSDYYDTLVDYSEAETPEEPVDLYVIGADVDGEEWALGTNKMTYADGVYTWTGEYLGNGFKINDGTWGPEYNIGAGEGNLTLGTAYTVAIGDGTGNINFADYEGVNNPKVVYDPTAKTVTVTGEGVSPEGPVVLYVRGEMNSWATTDEMTQDPDNENIYVYAFDTVVGSDAKFKIADANWGKYNFGAPTEEEGNIEVYSDKPAELELADNGEDIVVTNWVAGPMIITFNLETKELLVEGSDQPKFETGAIHSLGSDASEVEYYNLQGVKVVNPDKGIYIIRKGNTTSKAVIR